MPFRLRQALSDASPEILDHNFDGIFFGGASGAFAKPLQFAGMGKQRGYRTRILPGIGRSHQTVAALLEILHLRPVNGKASGDKRQTGGKGIENGEPRPAGKKKNIRNGQQLGFAVAELWAYEVNPRTVRRARTAGLVR